MGVGEGLERERESNKVYLCLGLSLFHKEHEHTAHLPCTIHLREREKEKLRERERERGNLTRVENNGYGAILGARVPSLQSVSADNFVCRLSQHAQFDYFQTNRASDKMRICGRADGTFTPKWKNPGGPWWALHGPKS